MRLSHTVGQISCLLPYHGLNTTNSEAHWLPLQPKERTIHHLFRSNFLTSTCSPARLHVVSEFCSVCKPAQFVYRNVCACRKSRHENLVVRYLYKSKIRDNSWFSWLECVISIHLGYDSAASWVCCLC